jgi:hypothetical protein
VPAIDAAESKKIMNLPQIANDVMENLIDLSVDVLNLFSGGSIPNMGGTAGSKTLSLSSAQRGAVFLVVRAVYYGFQKDLTGKTVGDISIQPADLLSNPKVLETIQLAAVRLSPSSGASGSTPEINVRRG